MFAKLGLAPAQAGGSTNSNSHASKGDLSLISVLNTRALRVEYVSLVAICTDAMRRDLLAVFEYDQNSALPGFPNQAQQLLQESLIDLDNTHGINSTPQPNIDAGKKLQEELSSPQVRALRRSTLAFFDGWQVKVLRRIGEALSVKSEMIRNARANAASQAATNKKVEKDPWDGVQDEQPVEQSSLPVHTPLTRLEEPKRDFILNCLLLLLLSLETYPAHSRVLLLRITACLGLPKTAVAVTESAVAYGLLDTAAKQMSADDSVQRHAEENAVSRRWKIGLATVGGAALIGITGGLAAPLLVAGVGGVMGALGLGAVASLLGAVASSSVLIGGLFGAYGGKMTGQLMEIYAKEVEDFKFLPIKNNLDSEHDNHSAPGDEENLQDESERRRHRLRVAIGISGWLTSDAEIYSPWHVLSTKTIEPFALQWEVAALLRLGTTMRTVMENYLVNGVSYAILRHTVLSTLMMGLWPLTILQVAKVADNPFSVAKSRADKAGQVLAEALMAKAQGERPVTLIGFSMGARVIWSCLQTLAEDNAFGLVENVVVMGAPVPADSLGWRKASAVVAGRLVNVFSKDDWILGVLYRSSAIQLGVAGLQPVLGVSGVDNYDASDLVKGHIRYRYAVGQILRNVGIEDVDEDMMEKEREVWSTLEADETKVKNEWSGERERLQNESIILFDMEDHEHVATEEVTASSSFKGTATQTPTAKDQGAEDDDVWESDFGQRITMLDLDPLPEAH